MPSTQLRQSPTRTPIRRPERVDLLGRPFDVASRQVISQLQDSVRAAIDALPGPQILHATDLARTARIDNKLAWKMHSLAQLRDPFEAGQFVPGRHGVKLFLEGCRRAGVKASSCDRVDRHLDAFMGLIKVHAGNRRAFDMLLAGQSSTDSVRRELAHRKTAFEAQSYLYGVMTRLHLQTYILLPTHDEDRLDLIDLHANVDLQRFRPDVPWRISRMFRVNEEEGRMEEGTGQPIDPDHPADPTLPGLPLIPKFCSQPLPVCERLTSAGGDVVYQLKAGPVGRTSTNTCVTGEYMPLQHAKTVSGNQGKTKFFVATRLRTPCEAMALDLVLPTAWVTPRFSPQPLLYSDLFGKENADRFECDRLPLTETVERLALTDEAVAFDTMPRYREMLEFAIQPHGLSLDDLTIFRLHIPYPTIPSNAYLQYDLRDLDCSLHP
ncbi:MAG: hypothetical protein AAF797_00735 [Planctomycetota bacterium]